MNTSNLFICKTNSLSNDKYLLKLNRTDSCLEVYSKVSNSKLNEYYSIRSDFDSSEYTMFEKIESMPCLVAKNHLLLMAYFKWKRCLIQNI